MPVKVVGGVKCDTEKARLLGSYSNSFSDRDQNNITERLYRNRAGRYFLYCQGDGLSLYAQRAGNSYTSRNGFVLLEPDEAREWAEKHLSVQEYEDAFGAVMDTLDHQLTIRLTPATMDEIRNHVTIPVAEWGRALLLKELGRLKAKKAERNEEA